jgi:hypothetical protein
MIMYCPNLKCREEDLAVEPEYYPETWVVAGFLIAASCPICPYCGFDLSNDVSNSDLEPQMNDFINSLMWRGLSA